MPCRAGESKGGRSAVTGRRAQAVHSRPPGRVDPRARQEVVKSEIEARKLQNASPMPSGLVKTPAELADLLAYLLGEIPQAP